jgi:hypothetical protein
LQQAGCSDIMYKPTHILYIFETDFGHSITRQIKLFNGWTPQNDTEQTLHLSHR